MVEHTMYMRVCDVLGDGNCFYRCLYEVVMQSGISKLIESFGLDDLEGTLDSQTEGADMLRNVLANMMTVVPNAKKAYQELFALYEDCDEVTKSSLEEMYPVLSGSLDFKDCVDKIRTTNIHASSMEIDIFRDVLRLDRFSVELVIVSESQNDAWEVDIRKALATSPCRYFCVLVNSSNVHYKYISFEHYGAVVPIHEYYKLQ